MRREAVTELGAVADGTPVFRTLWCRQEGTKALLVDLAPGATLPGQDLAHPVHAILLDGWVELVERREELRTGDIAQLDSGLLPTLQAREASRILFYLLRSAEDRQWVEPCSGKGCGFTHGEGHGHPHD